MTLVPACLSNSSRPRSFGSRWAALALCAMCVLVAGSARADEPAVSAPAPKAGAGALQAPDESPVKSPGPPPEALAHYNRGRAHYQAGRYREAVVELEKALSLDPQSPNLVYNVARVYELLGDMERSIAFYERYKRMLPAQEREER